MTVNWKDFEVRYANIRKNNPNIENCSFEGCLNPVDITEGMGKDTTCAFHRLLFDFWIYEVCVDPMKVIAYSKEERRRRFTEWTNKIGIEKQKEIVLEMAQSTINWMC